MNPNDIDIIKMSVKEAIPGILIRRALLETPPDEEHPAATINEAREEFYESPDNSEEERAALRKLAAFYVRP